MLLSYQMLLEELYHNSDYSGFLKDKDCKSLENSRGLL